MVQLRLSEVGIPIGHEDLMSMFSEGHAHVAHHMRMAKELMEKRIAETKALIAKVTINEKDACALPDLDDFTKVQLQDALGKVPHNAKDREDKDKALLASILKKSVPTLFAGTPDERLIELAGTLPLQRYTDKQVIVREGDVGHEYFLVLSGKVSVVVGLEMDKSKKKKNHKVRVDLSYVPDYMKVGTLDVGGCFGENALLSINALRKATCIATANQRVGDEESGDDEDRPVTNGAQRASMEKMEDMNFQGASANKDELTGAFVIKKDKKRDKFKPSLGGGVFAITEDGDEDGFLKNTKLAMRDELKHINKALRDEDITETDKKSRKSQSSSNSIAAGHASGRGMKEGAYLIAEDSSNSSNQIHDGQGKNSLKRANALPNYIIQEDEGNEEEDEEGENWRSRKPDKMGCVCLVIRMSIAEIIRKATNRRTYTETLCLACMVREKLPLFKDTPQDVLMDLCKDIELRRYKQRELITQPGVHSEDEFCLLLGGALDIVPKEQCIQFFHSKKPKEILNRKQVSDARKTGGVLSVAICVDAGDGNQEGSHAYMPDQESEKRHQESRSSGGSGSAGGRRSQTISRSSRSNSIMSTDTGSTENTDPELSLPEWAQAARMISLKFSRLSHDCGYIANSDDDAGATVLVAKNSIADICAKPGKLRNAIDLSILSQVIEKHNAFFSKLPSNTLHELCRNMEGRHFPAGEICCLEGCQGKSYYFLMHGHMAVVKGHLRKGQILHGKEEGDRIDIANLPPFEQGPPPSGTLAYVKAGTGFGELATLAVAASRAATCIAYPTEGQERVFCLELCVSLRGVITKHPEERKPHELEYAAMAMEETPAFFSAMTLTLTLTLTLIGGDIRLLFCHD